MWIWAIVLVVLGAAAVLAVGESSYREAVAPLRREDRDG